MTTGFKLLVSVAVFLWVLVGTVAVLMAVAGWDLQ